MRHIVDYANGSLPMQSQLQFYVELHRLGLLIESLALKEACTKATCHYQHCFSRWSPLEAQWLRHPYLQFCIELVQSGL